MNRPRSPVELALIVSQRILDNIEAHPAWPAFVARYPRAAGDAAGLRRELARARLVPPAEAEVALEALSSAFDGLACALAKFRLAQREAAEDGHPAALAA